MGLFSEVLGAAMGSTATAAAPATTLQSAIELIHNPAIGGLGGLASKFESAGLGHLMQGWVSNGPNPAVSPDQLTKVLGSPMIEQFASKLGISPEQAAGHLSQLLPHLVDQMTPGGTVPAIPTSAADVFNLIKSKI